MLTQLRIKNFKAWRDTQEIRLAPITVFFGNNSSGKSSIHQLLLMLKQTARSSDRSQVLDPGDGRGLVELGTFRDMIHNHVSGDHLGFEIGWDLPKPLRIVDSKTMKQSTPIKHLRFSCEVGENGGPSGQMSLYRLAYSTAGDNEPGMSFSLSRSAKEAGKFELTASGYDLVGQVGRKWAMGRPVHFYGFPGEAVARYQNSACLPDLALEFERLMDSVHYIGPLREHPKRTYVVSGAAPEHVGEKGEYWLPALLSGLGRKFNRQPKAHYIPFEDLIESWGDKLGLMRSFRPRPLSENGKDYQVDIRTAEGRPEVRLPDVGFGVSQILPVLVECFYVKPHSTIILEQPEIHLHPSVQASLADLFVETIKLREDNSPRGIQVLIESHSEHFLRRLQRRIAEGAISEKDAALYFCKSGPDGSLIEPLELDEFGFIKNWPDNFFGDAAGDLIEMTKAGLDRRLLSRS